MPPVCRTSGDYTPNDAGFTSDTDADSLPPVRIDPGVFAPESIADDTSAFIESVREILHGFPAPREMESPQAVRDFRRSGEGPYGPLVFCDWAETRTIPGPVGDLGVRVFVRGEPEAVYLHFHGGGWVLGEEDMADPRHEAMVEATGFAVFSVGYRKAPEHKWPAGNDDCEAAARWLVDNAREEFGTEALFIGGESAGAHLVSTTLLRLRDKHGYTGWSGANLIYGVYDLRNTHSRLTFHEDPILDGDGMEWFARHYLEGTDGAERLDDPDISPVLADLRGLPPALFTIGTLDPLLDENLAMAARYAAAGNQTELAVYPGGFHAFDAFDFPLAEQAKQRMYAWMGERLQD